MTGHDGKMMLRALRLAARGLGGASPNPLVGAVIAKGGLVLGEGFHEKYGCAHAEINAIRSAGARSKGADLYVTLEPCCTYGKTPPCTDAIISAGIRRVFIGCLDRNPKHAGSAVRILRQAGIETFTGVHQDKCEQINESFFFWITTGRPFVLLKMASTLDGKIADSKHRSKWITGEKARKRVQRLRLWADAILVGGNTARQDRPSLTVRDFTREKQPRRLVASKSLSGQELAVLMPGEPVPEIISASSPEGWLAAMEKLGSENVSSLLVEGGGTIAFELLRAKVVNRVEFHIAPTILGGNDCISSVGGAGFQGLDKALKLCNLKTRRLGDDIIISGNPAEVI